MRGIIKASFHGAVLGMLLLWAGCAGDRYSQSTGEFIDSSAITAKVKAALIDDPSVKAFDINVDTFKEVVQLNGFVDSAEQKKRAEQIAWGIEGVRGVKNNLTVKEAVIEKDAPRTNEPMP